MQNTISLSIIVATHNRAEYLPGLAKTILEQPYQNFELVIVDDASQDDSNHVLKQLEKRDIRIKTIHLEKNSGPGAARNAGFAIAQGRFLAIHDDDDIPMPHRFSKQVAILEEDPTIDLVFSAIAYMDLNLKVHTIFPKIIQNNEFPQDPDLIFRLLYMDSNRIPNTTLMIRRELWENYGGYPEKPWIGEDWYLFMKWAALGVRMHSIPEPLVNCRHDPDHSSMMKQTELVLKSRRQVLQMIRAWLKTQNIHRFDYLHNRVFSNLYVREARARSGLRGIGLCLKALVLNPSNTYAWGTLDWLRRKSIHKFRRLTKV